MENVLEVKNLVKNFGNYHAVKGISFVVPKGKVIGLLGPNGAGKTTTIHMLIGITSVSSGAINYFGMNFFKHQSECLARINYTSSYNNLLGRISVYENLLVFAMLYNVKHPKKKIYDLIDYFEIPELLTKSFWSLSAGQRTRVNLIKSLLNDPQLLLMDEPTASLDPDIADKLLTLIEDLKKSNETSILYTSHNMDEVTRVCDEVIFLSEGEIVAQDTPLGLTKRIPNITLKLTFDGKKQMMEKILHDEKQHFTLEHNNTVVMIQTTEQMVPKIIYKISKSNIWITDIEVIKPTLEDVFLQIARGGKNHETS